MKSLSYLNKYLLKYKLRFGLGAIFVCLSVYFSILIPPTIRKALNFIIDKTKDFQNASEDQNFIDTFGSDILRFSIMLIGFSILSGFFMYCMRKTIIVMSRLIEYDLRKEIYEHYQVMDLAFFKRNKTGDLMARVSEDVVKVRMYLGPAIMYGLRVSFLFSFIIYSMFQVNSTLTWYTLLPLPFLSISIYYVSILINKRSALIQEQVSVLNSTAQEVYSGIRIVKSYVKESKFQNYFDDQSYDYKVKALNLARINALFYPLMILLVSMSTLLTIYIGGTLVAKGEITAGNIAEFIIYINMLTWPITSIGWIASIIQQAEASQKRINEFLNIKPEITNQSKHEEILEGTIEFNDVSFTYPDTGIEAIKDVSFKIAKGQNIALIGRTASGKTTIGDLLLRFYDVTKGQIKIDGKDIKEHNLSSLRDKIGYVPQNVFLFSNTIAENISFGSEINDPVKIYEFAEKAVIKNDINSFPEKFETMVGERGITLSGGQKQRISIARALIKNPDIVILDDCLSAVDANTEFSILNHLSKDLKHKTCIIITHRISHLMQFDQIIVLEKGQIEAIGTHEELMDSNEYYRSLASKSE